MGLEAVETILKAIQGAKARRLDAEQLAERRAEMMAQLKQADDHFKIQEKRLDAEHQLEVQKVEAKNAQDRLANAVTKQQLAASMEDTSALLPGATSVENVNPDPINRSIPGPQFTNPRFGQTAPVPQMQSPLQSGVRTITLPGDLGTLTGVRTPEEKARQAGITDFLKNKPTKDYEAGLSKEEKIREEGVAEKVAKTKAQTDWEMEQSKQEWESYKLAVEMAQKRDAERAANARNAADNNTRLQIAARGEVTPERMETLKDIADKVRTGTWTKEDVNSSLGLKANEKGIVQEFLRNNGSQAISNKARDLINDTNTILNGIDEYDDVINELSTSENKLGAAAGNLFKTSAETKGKIAALNALKLVAAKVSLGQSRVTDADADTAGNRYLPSYNGATGTMDTVAVLKNKRDNLKKDTLTQLRSIMPNVSTEQLADMYRARNLRVPRILGGEDSEKTQEMERRSLLGGAAQKVPAPVPPAPVINTPPTGPVMIPTPQGPGPNIPQTTAPGLPRYLNNRQQ